MNTTTRRGPRVTLFSVADPKVRALAGQIRLSKQLKAEQKVKDKEREEEAFWKAARAAQRADEEQGPNLLDDQDFAEYQRMQGWSGELKVYNK